MTPYFFERSWHDLQIHDYLELLKVFKELGRRYFVDILLPDKDRSTYATYTNQVATYSPFRVSETGLSYKLVFNVPIYFADTTVSANAYVASEDGLGFGKDVVFNAVMFTDTAIDTVETGALVHLYPIQVDTEQYYELYKLLTNNQITEALAYYQTYVVGNSAIFEIVSTNRFTLSDRLGFIWQIHLKKTDKRIDFNQTNITEFFVYDAYYNNISQVRDYLIGYWLWQLYEILEQLLTRKAYTSYPGVLLPYDRYTLTDVILWLQSRLSSAPRDLGLLGVATNRYISKAYSQMYTDIVQALPANHLLRYFLSALANRQPYNTPTQYTANVRTRYVQSHYPYYLHGYVYAVDDPYTQVLGIDSYVASLLEHTLVSALSETQWYPLWSAIVSQDVNALEQISQAIIQMLKPYVSTKAIDTIIAEQHESFTIDFQLILTIVLSEVAQRIRW